MTRTFGYAATFNQDVGAWDTSKVTNLRYAFRDAAAFDQDIGNWDTSKVTTMDSAFYEASTFNAPIGGWDTSSVTTLYGTFKDAAAFNADIGDWDTSKVTTMSSTFWDAPTFNRPIGDWDVSSVTRMSATFFNNALKSAFNANIKGWDVSKVTDIDSLFRGASAFNADISDWDTSKDIDAWDASQVSDMGTRAGVVHLDVKPANLLYASLARGAPLKIVDFGLAASVEDTGDEPRPWVLRGTPGYMAPELVTDGAPPQVRRLRARRRRARALTGAEPFCLDRKATAREIFACTAQCRVAFDEEIESIRRLFRAVSGDGGEHLSIVDFGRVMAALDMPFTPDVLFPIYDRTRAGTVSAEDFARCVTAVRRAMVSDDAETFPGPAYEHAGLAFDAPPALARPLARRGRPRSRRTIAAAIAAHNGPRGARAACPLLFGVFFLSVSYKMERPFERDAAPRAGRATGGPDSGVLEAAT
ncbi:calmodulin-dependent protein kinase [Aureococcus anophagefferens]|nr:calmodulin-dependent protein kinase [Aureococcus anophagefferens]